jgi:hypothetical protein
VSSSVIFPSGLHTKTTYVFRCICTRATCPALKLLLHLITKLYCFWSTGHSEGLLWSVTLKGHSEGSLWRVTRKGHSEGRLWRYTLKGDSEGTLWRDTLKVHSEGSLSLWLVTGCYMWRTLQRLRSADCDLYGRCWRFCVCVGDGKYIAAFGNPYTWSDNVSDRGGWDVHVAHIHCTHMFSRKTKERDKIKKPRRG